MKFRYKGFNIIHQKESMKTIKKLLQEHQPELIIELGTGWGGLTLFFGSCVPNAKVHTYDLPKNDRDPKNHGRMKRFDGRYTFHNVDILTKSHPQLTELCKDKRKKFLYCDNGDKIKEMRTYGIHLNKGDLLGVHDWGRVIEYDDVKDILVDFEPIEEEIFEKNKWVSRFWIRTKNNFNPNKREYNPKKFEKEIKCTLPQLRGMTEDFPENFQEWLTQVSGSDTLPIFNVIKHGRASGHVCTVLKGIGFTLYFYEFFGDYTKEQCDIFEYIRLVLDRLLVANQVASAMLVNYLVKFEEWKGPVFPRFFTEYDEQKIREYSDQVEKEIEDASNKKYVYKKKDRGEYWNKILKKRSWDIKGCYAELLSIFNTIKSDLPKENIFIIEELILRCEHGYYLGFLLEKSFREFTKRKKTEKSRKKTEKSRKKIKPKTTKWLTTKLTKFKRGRELRIYEACKETVDLNEKEKKKLRRMFVFQKVE